MTEQVDLEKDADVLAFLSGELLVYPTEAVMGIGCDPDNEEAVMRLLQLKKRDISKGVILIAANYSQLLPYVNDKAIGQDRRTEIFSSWPGPVTWLLPKSAATPTWLCGEHDTIAVRVTNHPVVVALCKKLGKPLVSTSANLSGQPPARDQQQAREYFSDNVHYIDGVVGSQAQPSTIKHGETGQIIRA